MPFDRTALKEGTKPESDFLPDGTELMKRNRGLCLHSKNEDAQSKTKRTKKQDNIIDLHNRILKRKKTG